MKNLKKSVSLLLISVMIMSFAGCSDESGNDKKSTSDSTTSIDTSVVETTTETSKETSFIGQKWNLGAVTKTGLDNGFTGDKEIENSDPHYGWNLGQFYVCGYTQRTNDSQNGDVFLKNVGDKVELHFELLQDIDGLNGNEHLVVNSDRNPYDQYFKTQKFNDCRGLLIIRKTDYRNQTEDPVIYQNYLDGVKQGADTIVELCEEGDYEVALDYELKLDHYGADWNDKVTGRLVDGKMALVRYIDLDYEFEGIKNIDRMLAGKAPIDPATNLPYELHHIAQEANETATFAILTQAEHRGEGNFSILHDLTKDSVVDRNAFAAIRAQFWKDLVPVLQAIVSFYQCNDHKR